MSSLHLVNTSSAETWQQLQRALHTEDAIILLADAVYLLAQLQSSTTVSTVHPAAFILSSCRSFALTDDLQARQIMLSDNCSTECIDYDRWVQLCVDFDKTVSWL